MLFFIFLAAFFQVADGRGETFLHRGLLSYLLRWEFDLNYSSYIIAHFPGFKAETPRLAAKFARTMDTVCSHYAWMTDDAFIAAIDKALDEFMGIAPMPAVF